MTPEERDRLVRAEDDIENLRDQLGRIEGKVDKLLTIAAMGHGVYWFATRIGAWLAVGLGAFFWAADHFRWWLKS